MARPAPAAGPEARKPNLVYILADDLGYGDLGCYGQQTLSTPHLDRMAAEGIRFTDHYAGSTVCAPSRCVLLTGLHTGHARIRSNRPGLLTDADVTLGQVLRRAGYRTACIGKWGVGNPPPPEDPNRRGFDHFFGYVDMWHAHNFYPPFLVRNGKRQALRNVPAAKWKNAAKGNGVAAKKVDYAPDLLQKEALRFVEDNRACPFFLYYAMNVPHANNEGGATGDGMEVPDFGEFAPKPWSAQEKGFAVMLRNIDRYVAEILAKLKALGIEDNTLVIFTSDNGPHQEGGHKMEFFNSNGGLRGMKRDLYEGGIRVPMIARWPGRIPARRTSGVVSGFQDMLPTLAEAADAKCPGGIDGISLLPTLFGRGTQGRHPHLYWEFPHPRAFKQAVRKGRWKAVRIRPKGKQKGRLELFDLVADPGEQNDVAAQNSAVAAEMAAIMDREHSAESPP